MGMIQPSLDLACASCTSGCRSPDVDPLTDLRRAAPHLAASNVTNSRTNDNRDNDVIRAALSAANALEFTDALPGGTHTILGENGLHLSGGQRQRIAIARMVVRRAPIVCLDEPMTGLDAHTAGKILTTLRKQALEHFQTIVLVSHQMHNITWVEQVIELRDGRVVDPEITNK